MDDETFDYGLDPGESFIPELDDLVDPAGLHVMTVLGPVDPETLGPVNLAASFVPRHRDADLGAILTEIHECAAVGLNALVDLNPIRTEMEALAARWLAERCDIHLIASTGTERGANGASNVARILDQAAVGFFASGVSPGVIVADANNDALAIARAAQDATGIPILLDCRQSPGGVEMGVRVPKIVTAVTANLEGDSLTVIDLAHQGFDTISAVQIQHAVRDSRVLFGYDPGSKRPEQFSRWSWFIEEFPLDLMERGCSPEQIRDLLVNRPAAVLTSERPKLPRC